MNALKYYCLVLFACSYSLPGFSQVQKAILADSSSRNWAITIPGNFSGQSKATFDSLKIDGFFKKYPNSEAYQNDVRDFYRSRKYAYAWFDRGLLIEQAGNLSNRVINLEREGVYKPVPYQKELDSMMNRPVSNISVLKPDITLELMLTLQYFVFSKLAWGGMDGSVSKANSWYLPRKKVKYDQYLDSLLATPVAQTAAIEPVYRQYELLRSYLKKYRALDGKNSWTAIAAGKEAFKAGSSSINISKIKGRLEMLGDYHGDTTDQAYNPELVVAIKQFQQRNGLETTGLPGKETLAALNVPIKARIKQILINMERNRWLPVGLDADYLAVNIPEFKLHVYHADSLLWSCSVVVGQTVHPTTVFYGEIKFVVFSPYWNVPESIIRNEVLPGIRRRPGYLKAHNMEITGRANGLPVVRQRPGPANSLGLVKFLFPNSYNIYLHDTPSKSLFGESSRAFSHGCIRVEEPAKLASFILKGDQQWSAGKISAAMNAGKERYVTLKEKLPVFITYFTAFVDREGRLNFRKDIYYRDDLLAAAILSGDGNY